MSISCLLRLNTYTINIYVFRYCNLSNSESKSNGLFPIFLFIYMQYIFYFTFFPSLRFGIHAHILYIYNYCLYGYICIYIL